MRIGQALANCMKNYIDDDTILQGYCEPFCGMLSVYKHIPDLFANQEIIYKAGDANESVIRMWEEAQNGWIPPLNCTENEYLELKDAKPSGAKGFIGHQCGFGGIYFGGFIGRYGKSTNITKASDRVCKIASMLESVKFSTGDYTQFSDLKGYLIYCDPPYSGTQCRYKRRFDADKFHHWCLEMSKYNLVFVSGYTTPNPVAEAVFQSSYARHNTHGHITTGSEHLFVYPR